jgi:tetratricopeptide (TPR) repeat protein
MTAHFNRSRARYALGNYQGTIDDLTTYLDADPGYPPAYENRGAAYEQLKQYEAARDDYQHALDLYEQGGYTKGVERVKQALARLLYIG